MKKRLKKQIDKLKSDNDLMHDIIADSPSMQELYDRWTKLLNVVHSSMRFEKFKVKRIVDDNYGMEYSKLLAAKDLLERIKDEITYKVDTEHGFQTVTASIIVAYSWQEEG
jgi:hypothetical protein